MSSHAVIAKPAILKWARESCNLSVQAAAKRATVKAEKLEEWEAGDTGPSLPQLRKLADAYRRPLAVFLLPEAPTDFQTIRDYRSVSGEETTSSYYLAQEVSAAQARREAALELADALGAKPLPFDLSCSETDDPEKVAAELRAALGVKIDEQLGWKDKYEALRNWKQAVERLGVLVFEMSRYVEVTEARGFSIYNKTFPIVAVHGSDSPRARIFTLGHELTHLLLRTGGICEFFEHISPEYQRIETFCNRVSAALLMPKKTLLSFPECQQTEDVDLELVATMAGRFGVSSEAMVIRLAQLGLIPRWQVEDALVALRVAAANYRAAQPKKPVAIPQFRSALKRNGVPFASLVMNAYRSETITLSDASSLLSLRTKHFGKLEQQLYGVAS